MAPPPILLSVRTSQLPPPQHTHTSCSSCLQEVLEWKMQVHIDQQTERNGEKQSITPILYMYLIFSVLYRLWYTHTKDIDTCVLSKAALIVVNMAIEHRPLSIINHGTVTDTLGQSAASRYMTFFLVSLGWSSVVLFIRMSICIFWPCAVLIDWFVKKTAENPPVADPVCKVNEEILLFWYYSTFSRVTWCKL